MLRFVTKAEYWELLDAGIEDRLAKAKFSWHLKSIQDVIAMGLLENLVDRDIAEIGGSFTRLLQHLSLRNRCVNIDRFDGSHGGSAEAPVIDGVDILRCYLGVDSEIVPSERFDAIYSISVIEHVPPSGLSKFFSEQWRIARKGALCVHLIDAYIGDGGNEHLSSCIRAYEAPFLDGRFESVSPSWVASSLEPLRFSTAYATNPDNVMHQWNRVAPAMRARRETSQSATLVWAGRRL